MIRALAHASALPQNLEVDSYIVKLHHLNILTTLSNIIITD